MFVLEGAPNPGCDPILMPPDYVEPQVKESVPGEVNVRYGMDAAEFVPEVEILEGMGVICAQ